MSSTKRTREETTAPSTEPPAKKAKIQQPSYLLCSVNPDELGMLYGYKYTPRGEQGKKVIQKIIDERVNRADLVNSLISALFIDDDDESENPKDDRTHLADDLLQHFPFLEKKDLPSIGSVEDWYESDLVSLTPIFYYGESCC